MDKEWPSRYGDLGLDHKFENDYIVTLICHTIKISMEFMFKIGD
jgi:hypothetical protein